MCNLHSVTVVISKNKLIFADRQYIVGTCGLTIVQMLKLVMGVTKNDQIVSIGKF